MLNEVNSIQTEYINDEIITAMRDISDCDLRILNSNSDYLIRLSEADKGDYELLMKNLELATSEKEREDIRNCIEIIRRERFEKDRENKAFVEKIYMNHYQFNGYTLLMVLLISGVALGSASRYHRRICRT